MPEFETALLGIVSPWGAMAAVAVERRACERTRVAVTCATVALLWATSPAGAQVAKKVFDQPAAIQSMRVDAAVLDIPLSLRRDEGSDEFSLASAVVPTLPIGELGIISRTATSTYSFGWMGFAAGAASADVWAEFAVDAPAIPEQVGEERVDFVEIWIHGRIKEANIDAVVCGIAFAAELAGVHIDTSGSPEADYELPSVGCIIPQTELIDMLGDIIDAAIDSVEDAWAIGQLAFGPFNDFVVRIPIYFPRGTPLHLKVQLGRRVSAALGAAGATAGEIQVTDIRVMGWAGVGPLVYLKTWHRYTDGPVTIKRLISTTEYDIRRAWYGIEPYPEVTFTCPPYPEKPVLYLRGRLYAVEGNNLWRLDYIERDGLPETRVPVTGTTCSFGPLKMDRSHRVDFGFSVGVADLQIMGLRLDPPQPQLGQRFALNILVQNMGDLSNVEADRGSPLDGWFKFRVKVGTAEMILPEARLMRPGESYEFFGLTWTCNGSLEVTVDADDEVKEGLLGERNNTASLYLPQCEPPTPTASPTRSYTTTRTPTRTQTSTRTATSTRTPSPARSPTFSRTPTSSRTPTRLPTPTITRSATRSATSSRTPTVTRSATTTGTATHAPTPSRTRTVARSPTPPPPGATSTPTATALLPPGDVNCDGHVSAADVVMLVRLIPTGDQGPCGLADVNQDTAVTSEDIDATVGLIFRPPGRNVTPITSTKTTQY